jgi:hypothetical protein
MVETEDETESISRYLEISSSPIADVLQSITTQKYRYSCWQYSDRVSSQKKDFTLPRANSAIFKFVDVRV